MAQSNREITLAIMIEELSALDEIEDIASTEGVDSSWSARPNVARAGRHRQTDHPKLVDTINRVAEVVRRAA